MSGYPGTAQGGEVLRARRAAPPLAAGLLVFLAAAKLAIHLATTGTFGYGFFVDELYYLALADHLAWGFVDMPPLFPAITALIVAAFGDSLLAVRLLPALAGAALVLLAGLLARELGGGRFAQGLAALGVLAAPIYLVGHSIHTMNALEPLFWMGCAWVMARIAAGAHPRLWILFGVLAGFGLLNKHSMAFYGAALVAGLLLTPMRRALRERWIWIGGAAAVLIFLPNLVWVVRNGFPHLEMLANIRAEGRDVALSWVTFLLQQGLLLNPLAVPLWGAGLWALLRDRDLSRWRALGIAWVALMILMLVLDGRVYYPAGSYPILFAAGGVVWERWRGAGTRAGRLAAAALPVAMGIVAAALAPTVLPCLPPDLYVRYAEATGLQQPRIETHRLGPLPQLHADRFGWPEMAAEVARVYHALPPGDRAKAAIFAQNYGQAGAIDLFGPALGLPKAISGHLAYHAWGPRGATGEVVIVLDDDRETLEELFESVAVAGRVEHPLSMPYQHFDVWVCRGLRMPLEELWPRLRQWS